MSTSTEVANQFIDFFNLKDTINGGYEAVEKYYSNPSSETAYIYYRRLFTKRCTINGTYKGLLDARVDFQHLSFRRGDAIGALSSLKPSAKNT